MSRGASILQVLTDWELLAVLNINVQKHSEKEQRERSRKIELQNVNVLNRWHNSQPWFRSSNALCSMANVVSQSSIAYGALEQTAVCLLANDTEAFETASGKHQACTEAVRNVLAVQLTKPSLPVPERRQPLPISAGWQQPLRPRW